MKLTNLIQLIVASLIAACIPSCGTPAGTTVAGILTSPTTQAVISMAVKAGESALFAKTGQKLSPEGQAALTAAVTPLVDQVTASTLNGIAAALRGKQTTPAAADSGKLIVAVTSTTPTPVPVAVSVAEAVPVIVNTSGGSVTPADANAAVQAAVQSVASQRAGN